MGRVGKVTERRRRVGMKELGEDRMMKRIEKGKERRRREWWRELGEGRR